jgi:hypothetical protein
MRDRFARSPRPMIALLALAACSSFAAAQATRPTPQGGAGIPETANARRADDGPGGPAPVHDFNGIWLGPEEAALSNRVPALTPAGQAKLKLNIPDPFSATSNDPWKTCDPFGMPRAANNQIGQIGFATMPNRLIMLVGFRMWREIWMDGRQPPKNIGQKGGPSTMTFGYSVGHWEGDHTLVIDTYGMDENTWADRRGYPHSTSAHVIERYDRPDHNHLTFTETIDDPAYYTQSFVIAKGALRWSRGQEDPKLAAIPFTEEHLCVPSQAIEYMKLLGNPADEDSVTGNKPKSDK